MICEENSWLPRAFCAHCLGHKLDPELEEVAAANVQQALVTIP